MANDSGSSGLVGVIVGVVLVVAVVVFVFGFSAKGPSVVAVEKPAVTAGK